ncbi:mitochondrial ribonuclease P catalytic subunit isoform X2 [Syngnathoides biaculeatus]|uniref:mitochondrial ribonuclease P catalytic subunit isoform X2 n=1 Tax=Syngnathoides biaculeatus TaxID=300417 RepID=UPI002ADD9AE0|nr:mitochondrial ribonuclease P catalytic subunit isoform X2 [Syngnathoides biaculeatus]
MGFTIILKLKLGPRPAIPFINQGSSAFLTLPYLVLSHCCMNWSSSPGLSKNNGRETNVQARLKYSTIRQRGDTLWDVAADVAGKKKFPSTPKYVFAAGTAKRTAEILRRKTGICPEESHHGEPARKTAVKKWKLEPPDQPLSVEEWKKLKESLGSPERFDTLMLSALLNSRAELDIAKSLLSFVATDTGTLSYKLLLQYLVLCVNGNHDQEVLDVYNIIRENFPSLDTGAYSLVIKSFSRSARWQEALSMLNDMKKVVTPSPSNYGNIIAAAMLNGHPITAWALYDELLAKGLNPQHETWSCLFKSMSTAEEETMLLSEQQERLQGILMYMRNNQVYPQLSLASSIKTWFESIPRQMWKGTWSSASPNGMCKSCGTELESIQLTAEEYQQLRNRVMTDIIQGHDVFNKTTPEVAGAPEPIPAVNKQERGYTLNWLPSQSQGTWRQTTSALTITRRGNLECPINVSCFLRCGRIPERLEKTHAGMGRTCKLHTGGP